MRVLVTGGSGFIGSNLVKYLYKNTDYTIYIVDDLSTGNYYNIKNIVDNKRVFFKKIDISKIDIIDHISEISPKKIFHIAAKISVPLSFKDPARYYQVNVLGTQNILEAAMRSGSSVIFSSSSSVYGEKNYQSFESDTLNPISPYAMTKKICEDICKFYSKIYGVNTAILRYFNVYGPGQSCNSPYSGVLSLFCNYKVNNKNPTIYGDGSQSRDFTYVEDIVEINYLISNKNTYGEIFNVAPGKTISLNKIIDLLNIKNVKYEKNRDGDIKTSHSNSDKLKDFLQYTFKYDINRGLKTYLEYLNDNTLEKNK